MAKKITLTFDYELFFRQSGTVEKCLIEPVNRLIEIFTEHQMKATFFVDTIFIERLLNENEDTIKQAKKIIDQLTKLIEIGCRIELHLHTHWLDAKYDESKKEWDFPSYKNYRLDALPSNEIEILFETGVKLLNNIARVVYPHYQVCAFRAGGYCIEPFTILKSSFIKNNILIDSSVVFGRKGESITHKYNFLNHPNKSIYKFTNCTCEENVSGSFYEVPISTYKISPFTKLKQFIFHKIFFEKYKRFGDGIGMSDNQKSKLGKLIDIFIIDEVYVMYSLESIISPKSIVKKIDRDSRSSINIISHPKSISKNSIKILQELSQSNFKFETLDNLIKDY